jgi:endonuclease YncB( thermonuclease family)
MGRTMRRIAVVLLGLGIVGVLAACADLEGGESLGTGETARVVNVVDGDTIDVLLNGARVPVRYIGINTPERGETCYTEAREANQALVGGQTVTLVADAEDTDQYGRLLRYIYVGDVFVNAELVEAGFAEVVRYRPNDAQFNLLRNLEIMAADAGRGCHPTGIFDDDSFER